MSARSRWRGLRAGLAPPFQEMLERAVADAETILDVGCGAHSPLASFRRRRWSVGVDAYEPAVAASRAARIHDEYHVADVRSIAEMFPERSFDAVVAFDVLEHLEEAAGLDLLAAMERLARARAV